MLHGDLLLLQSVNARISRVLMKFFYFVFLKKKSLDDVAYVGSNLQAIFDHLDVISLLFKHS